jgi:hypothetical protein
MTVTTAFVPVGIPRLRIQPLDQRFQVSASPSRRACVFRRRAKVPAVLAMSSKSPEKPLADTDVPPKDDKPALCQTCGIEGGPKYGCDGTGRIVGGLGAIVDWWPIKAYRPCPELTKAKKTYQRSGQSLDEIAFGRLDAERTVE